MTIKAGILLPNEATIIEWVNEQRDKLGLKPIRKIHKGHKKSPCDCPIARSLKYQSNYPVRVGGGTFNFGSSKKHLTPLFIKIFIEEFDFYIFPEYELKK